MARRSLTTKQIESAVKGLQHFVLSSNDKKLTATFVFPSHVSALAFLARITVLAEVMQHHPDVLFTHSKLKITLTTHELKGLTKVDVELAKRIERSLPVKGG